MDWKWDSLKSYTNYKDRIEKARNAKVVALANDLVPTAVIQGQSGENHSCTLDNCDCKAYTIAYKRGEPCFHMIRLAMELGILDEHGMTEQECTNDVLDSLESKLSRCYWSYHVLKKPLVDDRVYDGLKAEYYSKLGENNSDICYAVDKPDRRKVEINKTNHIRITVSHAQLERLYWRVIDIDDDYATLWSDPIVEAPFFNLKTCREARYIRTDYSGKNKNTGKLLKVQENDNSEESDQNTARRYADIKAYGSNQWAVSTLREYLNGEFYLGLPEDFKAAIVPQTHDVLLRQVASADRAVKSTDHKAYDDSTTVYDCFSNGLRSTYSRVTDRVYLPSLDSDKTCKSFFATPGSMVQSKHYWLMDAQISTDGAPYLTKIVANCRDSKGRFYSSVTSSNACQEHGIFICPVCVVKADYLYSLIE